MSFSWISVSLGPKVPPMPPTKMSDKTTTTHLAQWWVTHPAMLRCMRTS